MSWKIEIETEEAIELSDDNPLHEERGDRHRWYTPVTYVVKDDRSPTGLMEFTLYVPHSFELCGTEDYNDETVECYAVVEQEEKVIRKTYPRAI